MTQTIINSSRTESFGFSLQSNSATLGMRSDARRRYLIYSSDDKIAGLSKRKCRDRLSIE